MAIKFGTAQDDELTGTEHADLIFGRAGDDLLKGGDGIDLLFGGAGNDTYIVDRSDTVFEFADRGTDAVVAGFSYQLGSHLENLTLSGTGDINGTGNVADNLILGNAGSNILTGGAGDDTLDGGFGGEGGVFGVDIVLGGAGDDKLIFDPDDLNAEGPTEALRYEGGTGIDTLVFAESDQALNLASTSVGAITDVEVFDLSGAGNHALLFTQNAVLWASASTQTIRVDGGAGDRVGTLDPDWLFAGNEVIGGQIYAEYTRGEATLLVDEDIDRGGIAAFPLSVPLSVGLQDVLGGSGTLDESVAGGGYASYGPGATALLVQNDPLAGVA
jgi:Ca2+-binding RTX toxin-like protein